MSQMPINELTRLASLLELDILDSEPEAEFDALVRAAATLCDTPISLITLVDEKRQWFKANLGLSDVTQTCRSAAFCSHTIQGEGIFEVADAATDPRFFENVLVTDTPNIRFYAGYPLRLSDGSQVGSLCVIDNKPRALTRRQRNVLYHLTQAAICALESRRTARSLMDSESRFRTLCAAAPLGVYATDTRGQVTYTNDRWLDIFGLDDQAAQGSGWSSVVHEDDEASVKAQWQSATALQIEFDREYRIVDKNGAERCVRSISRPVYTEQKTLVGHVGSVEDVSERKSQVSTLRRTAQLLEQTVEMTKSGGWEFDLTNNRVIWNEQACKIHGVPSGYQPKLEEIVELYAEEQRPMISEVVSQAMLDGTGWDLELKMRRASGEYIWVRVMAHIERLNGKPVRVSGVIQDIDDVVRQRLAIEDANERMTLATDSGQIGIWELDIPTGTVAWTPQMYRLFGEHEHSLVTFDFWSQRVHPDDLDEAENAINRAIAGYEDLDTEFRIVWPDESVHYIRATADIKRDSAGTAQKLLGVNWDVTEQRLLTLEMSYRATHDALTGLVNRAEFEHRLQASLTRVSEGKPDDALMFIDLDQFKLVNDACGHAVGDQLLKQVSELMAQSLGPDDTLARLGGDEFGIILCNHNESEAQKVAQLVCKSISDFRFLHGERRFRIGASIGLVPLDNRWTNTASMLRAADTACYAAKEAGRNRVHVWFDSDAVLSMRHSDMQWAARIEQSLDDERFDLYAQLLKPLSGNDDALQLEVLLRWYDDTGKLTLPSAFLPAAERFHLASRIDRWVLQKSINTLCSLPDMTHVGMIWVNLSGQSVGDRDFHKDVLAMLAEAGPAVCCRICLEITETAAVTNITDAAAFITQLRTLGVSTALDDFGAGASSFAYLKTLPVDILKIDGQFVANLAEDPLDEAAVRCFVDVAHVVGLKTVTECVDHPEVLERARRLGVDYAQGFMLHEPEPLLQLLNRDKAEADETLLVESA